MAICIIMALTGILCLVMLIAATMRAGCPHKEVAHFAKKSVCVDCGTVVAEYF